MQSQEAVRSKRLVRRTAGCNMHCSGPALVLCSSLINVLPVSVKAGRSVLARLITCSRVFFMFSPSYSLNSHFEGGDKPHPLGTHCSRLDFLCTKRRELENMRHPRQISYAVTPFLFIIRFHAFLIFLHSRDEHREVLFDCAPGKIPQHMLTWEQEVLGMQSIIDACVTFVAWHAVMLP